MAVVTETPTPIDQVPEDRYHQELVRLFDLYRLANLNARYYGRRAEKFESYNKWSMVIAALLSAAALGFLLGAEGEWVKVLAAILSGLTAVISGVTPFFGWTEKVRDLRSLRFAYSQLFGQIESVIGEIRRAGHVSPEHIGMAKIAYDAYSRIEALDELEPDQSLIDEEDEKVRKAFPEDYVWTHF